MGKLVALVIGYLLGAQTGGKDLEQLSKSMKALADTDEFADVVTAARAHVASTLRDLASILDGEQESSGSSDRSVDLVDRVRRLVERA
jgi:hypothetical protein